MWGGALALPSAENSMRQSDRKGTPLRSLWECEQ